MRSTDVFPSKYLKAEEFEADQEMVLTIKSVVMETLKTNDRGDVEKPVLYFRETPKGLVLNKTNWNLIARANGDESDEWPGRKITLYTMDVDSFGDIVSAIRVKAARKVAAPAKATLTPVQEIRRRAVATFPDPMEFYGWLSGSMPELIGANGIKAIEAITPAHAAHLLANWDKACSRYEVDTAPEHKPDQPDPGQEAAPAVGAPEPFSELPACAPTPEEDLPF